MVFASTEFLFLFLPVLLIAYYFPFCQNRSWRNGILLLFSVAFYAWGEPFFAPVMLASIVVNWALALFMARSRRHAKAWLATAILLDVSLLGVFKYLSFISENLARLTGNGKLVVEIALPIGISFFTFQLMSYMFDVYYGKATVQRNPFRLALYISLFPQLIAGPIVRYEQIAKELVERFDSRSDLLTGGMRRFVYGLGKKVLVANFLAQIANNIFESNLQQGHSVLFFWLGAIAYTLQIYFDFSGYSDMAIGLGRMFGFHLPENFNYPYIAGSVSDFWKRWHMTLTSWFRDYVYIPLGGNRVGKARWFFNFCLVWALTGIWHGANWIFLLWGLIYCCALLIEKTTGIAKKTNLLTRLWTFAIVVFAWVFFRAPTLSDGWNYASAMLGFGATGFSGLDFVSSVRRTWLVLGAALFGATPLLSVFFRYLRQKNCEWLEYSWLFLVFCCSLIEVVGSSYNPFIYFNF